MIELTTSNNIKVQLDNSDYFFFWKWSWHCNKKNYITRDNGNKTVTLHREIWIFNFGKIPDGKIIDHVNRIRLNCQKSNLRLVTWSESNRNRSLASNNTSGYKGVTFEKSINKWKAYIYLDDIRIHLGLFNTAIEAAHMYDHYAKIHFGEFAVLNFPEKE